MKLQNILFSKKSKFFSETAKLSSFTAAKEVLSVSQPAVSFQIKALENALNGPVFKRAKNTIFLTEAGILVQECIIEMKNIAKAYDEKIKESIISDENKYHINGLSKRSQLNAIKEVRSSIPNNKIMDMADSNEIYFTVEGNRID